MVIALVVSACVSSSEAETSRYEVEFDQRGSGLLELGPGRRACLTLEIDLPKAAHMHMRSEPTDLVLFTFFEPPTPARDRSCIENVRAWDIEYVGSYVREVYVDLHYNPRDEGVVGRLTPLP